MLPPWYWCNEILTAEQAAEIEPSEIFEAYCIDSHNHLFSVTHRVYFDPPQTGTSPMNLSTAIFLVNKGVRPVRVSYDPDWPKHNNPDVYFKTLDPSIKKDDYVVVPTGTRHGMTVCKVEEVDFRVNFDSTIEYKWVYGKVDKEGVDSIKAQENIVLDRVGDAEENRKRKELSEALQLDDINLSDLDIVTNASRAIPAPATPRGSSDNNIPESPPAPEPLPTSASWRAWVPSSDDVPL